MHSQRGEWCTGPFRRSASPAWSHPGKRRQVAPPGESVGSTVVVLAPVRATDAGKNEYLRRSEVPVSSAETRGLDAQGPRRLAGDGLAGERQPVRVPLLQLRDKPVDLDPARIPVADQVRQPQPKLDDRRVLLGTQKAWGEAAEVQH